MDNQNVPMYAHFSLESLSKETCVSLLKVYSRMMVALDGFWYLSCAEKTGTDSAVDSDIWVWTRLSRYVTQEIAQALGLAGRHAADYARVLQARPTHFLYDEEWQVAGRCSAIQTIRRCPTLVALEKEGQGREATHCPLACAPIREAHAKYFNPGIEVVCHRMPPRRGDDDIACQWEYVGGVSPPQPR